MRKVAQRAGITHGTIYLHFRDKEDLLYQVSEEQFRVLLDRLRALPRTLDPVNRIVAALNTIIEYGLDYPNHYALLYAIPSAWRSGKIERRFGPMAEEVYAYLSDALGRAHARGLLPATDPHIDTYMFLTAVHGVVELYRSDAADREETLQCAERMLTLLLAGLREPAFAPAAVS